MDRFKWEHFIGDAREDHEKGAYLEMLKPHFELEYGQRTEDDCEECEGCTTSNYLLFSRHAYSICRRCRGSWNLLHGYPFLMTSR